MQNDLDLKKLLENLAKDLVILEENESISEEELQKITEVYSEVYSIISELTKKSL